MNKEFADAFKEVIDEELVKWKASNKDSPFPLLVTPDTLERFIGFRKYDKCSFMFVNFDRLELPNNRTHRSDVWFVNTKVTQGWYNVFEGRVILANSVSTTLAIPEAPNALEVDGTGYAGYRRYNINAVKNRIKKDTHYRKRNITVRVVNDDVMKQRVIDHINSAPTIPLLRYLEKIPSVTVSVKNSAQGKSYDIFGNVHLIGPYLYEIPPDTTINGNLTLDNVMTPQMLAASIKVTGETEVV